MYRPNEKASFGVMYHHKKTMVFEDQDATLNNALSPGDDGYTWSATLLSSLGGSEQVINSELDLSATCQRVIIMEGQPA